MTGKINIREEHGNLRTGLIVCGWDKMKGWDRDYDGIARMGQEIQNWEMNGKG